MVVSGSFKQQPQRTHSNRNNETVRKARENTTRLTDKDQQTRIHDFYHTTREQLLQNKEKKQ